MVVEENEFTNLSSIALSGKIALERERLADERKERERRFELESQERHVIMDLLKEKVLKGWWNVRGKPICSEKKKKTGCEKIFGWRSRHQFLIRKKVVLGSWVLNTKWDLKMLTTLLKSCATNDKQTNTAIAPKLFPQAHNLIVLHLVLSKKWMQNTKRWGAVVGCCWL